jgi:hypothetical protein
MERLAQFLSTNPWVVIGLAALTLWPVLRWLWMQQTNASIWLARDSRYETDDVQLAAKNSSYYISQLVKNAENFAFFGLMGLGFYWFSSLFEYDYSAIGNSAAKAFTHLVGLVLTGAAFVTLLRTSYFSRSVSEAVKRNVSGKAKK